MNKRIFTLFVGACVLAGSSFTVNAQTPKRTLPYTPDKSSSINDGKALFDDYLMAEDLERLPENHSNYYYLLGVDGVANYNGFGDFRTLNTIGNLDTDDYDPSQFVLYVANLLDADGKETNPLRIENLDKLNSTYGFLYTGETSYSSRKLGAIRRASWCVNYLTWNEVSGSRNTYDFTNMETGSLLETPMRTLDAMSIGEWSLQLSDGGYQYKNPVSMNDDNNIVSGWHFSQAYVPSSELQQERPMFSYVKQDTVAVLVLVNDGVSIYQNVATNGVIGGFSVGVKHVSINDLIVDHRGNVNFNGVENVLLFSIKKMHKFVLNAHDWNVINFSEVKGDGISFNGDAKTTVRSNGSSSFEYINPFTDWKGLRAHEVNDSLYHYGYMQFQIQDPTSTARNGKYLYVDTSYVNQGINQYLSFRWDARRDSTFGAASGSLPWGHSFNATRSGNVNLSYVDYMNSASTAWNNSEINWELDNTIRGVLEAAVDRARAAGSTGSITTSGWNFELEGTANNIEIFLDPAATIATPGEEVALLPGEVIDLTQALERARKFYEEKGLVVPATGFDDFDFSLGSTDSWVLSPGAAIAGGLDKNWHYNEIGRDSKISNETVFATAFADFIKDTVAYNYAFHADSIMENQSKFRVVYDPFADSTFINVYQTRVQSESHINGTGNAAIRPNWWENSYFVGGLLGTVTTPSSYWGFTGAAAENAYNYFINRTLANINTSGTWGASTPGAIHGDSNFDYYVFGGDPTASSYNAAGGNEDKPEYHSFLMNYQASTPTAIDVVMVSTADTVALWNKAVYNPATNAYGNFRAMSHIYGVSRSAGVERKYRDSLFYVDIQDLNAANTSDRVIITLDQSLSNSPKGGTGLNTQIKLNFGTKCVLVEGVDKATIPNDLYLIRNSLGQFLSVPIWSIDDSVYWVKPDDHEDLTRIPSYQWAVENVRSSERSPFKLTNREFEGVEFEYVYAFEEGQPLQLSGTTIDATFNNRIVYGKHTDVSQALETGDVSAENFAAELAKRFPLDEISFIRLGKGVKSNQTIGYKYVDRDSTIVHTYAFKYLHSSMLQFGTAPRYLNWYGFESNDTTLYARGVDHFDRAYFSLEEMPVKEIRDGAVLGRNTDPKLQGARVLTGATVAKDKVDEDFAGLYNTLNRNNSTLSGGFVVEQYGYYKQNVINDLKPIARQAYRLFLQDYYRWHPTAKGHYLTVGQQNRYILSDKANAQKEYVAGTGRIEGLFGVPSFYFRETYFDVQSPGDDYFAMVQRLNLKRRTIDGDLVEPITGYYEFERYPAIGHNDVEEYLTLKFGGDVAKRVMVRIDRNNETGLFLLAIDGSASANGGQAIHVVRGEGARDLSTFQLVKDEDPIYRRFHVNEPSRNFGDEMNGKDTPDTLEFHILNKDQIGWRLYENSGNYFNADMSDRFGASGGRVYNIDPKTGDFKRDSIGHVLSFLGMNNSAQYAATTNYSFFVDTAYINRGTGWIKPQYLLAVDAIIPPECGVCNPLTGLDEGHNSDYVIARYMYNTSNYAKVTTDSVLADGIRLRNASPNYVYADKYYNGIVTGTAARDTTSGFLYSKENFNKVQPLPELRTNHRVKNANYLESGTWERFAFAWAIHKGDSLYVLKGVDLEPLYNENQTHDPLDLWNKLTKEYGSEGKYVDFKQLIEWNTVGTYKEAYYPAGERSNNYPQMRTFRNFKSTDQIVAGGKTIGLHAIIALDDNTHKDWVYSFRYIERGSDDFVIESETTNRDTRRGAMIRPGYGGWLKSENGVPVITRSDAHDIMGQAGGSVFNVKRVGNPVSNDVVAPEATSGVVVIGGTGNITVLNSAGKTVVVSNMLGQIIANTVATSDNATIAVPAGVVVVAVDGTDAVKAIVK